MDRREEFDSYRLQHVSPGAEEGMPMHDLSGMPDVYEHPEYYAASPEDRESHRVAKGVRGRPEAKVTVHRAVPDAKMGINPGDWVSPSRAYARQHGMHNTDPSKDMPVVSARVPASELYTDGNSLSEWGWNPASMDVIDGR